jgi:hypothetical protein
MLTAMKVLYSYNASFQQLHTDIFFDAKNLENARAAASAKSSRGGESPLIYLAAVNDVRVCEDINRSFLFILLV